MTRGVKRMMAGLVATAPLVGMAVLRAAAPQPVGTQADAPVTAPAATQGAALQAAFATQVKPFLETHCLNCHGNGKHKGDLSLDKFTSLEAVQSDEKTWRHVADMLRQKLMPPDNRPQPAKAEVDAVMGWIGEALAYCDCTGPRDPGRVAIHRLNRNEYNNTIRDLVRVDFKPADDFPADDTGYGFDNIADVLTMSPLLVEKYLAAAEQILERACHLDDPLKTTLAKYDSGNLQATGDGNSNGDLTKNGEAFADHEFVADGSYEIRVRAVQQKFGDEPAKMVLKLDGKTLETYDVAAQRGDKGVKPFVLKLDVKGGKRRVAAAYVNNKVDNNNPDPKKRGDRNLYVRRIEINGPLNPPPPTLSESYRRIFVAMPGQDGLSEEDAARKVIKTFATRAFRRPAKSEEVEQLLGLYRLARGEGDPFVASMKLPLSAVLVSPHFLFRMEQDPAGTEPGRISDYELATRLSYFLWSSMPDDELLALAASGRLREPGELAAHVKRMLDDPRAAELVRNFAGQWLELRNLDLASPDPKKYPAFDAALREDMRREAELFFTRVIREDRSVLEMLDADYTFLNERLAKLYGIEGVKGNDFRPVQLKPEARRGGVLTMAGVLTVTAMPSRTSPVKRGKFVLEQILGTPPPPAPADVPQLDETTQEVKGATQRERLEQHRVDPNCFVCHIRMDPIGFSLENFDPIGAWRDRDGPTPIDASGKLPEGQSLDGPAGLKRVLLEKKNEFVHCLVEKMMTYALGRGPARSDKCTINDVAARMEKNGYRFSDLVLGIVGSDAFQKRRGKDRTPDAPPLKADPSKPGPQQARAAVEEAVEEREGPR